MNLTFNFRNSNENKTFFPLLSGHLESHNCGLKIIFEAKLTTDNQTNKIKNISKIIFYFSLVYLIFSFNEFNQINTNLRIAKKVKPK